MIRSMTGFGTASVEFRNKNISVEIKSVNSKFFDLVLRLPPAYKDREMELRTDLGRFIERGKAEVSISCDSADSQKKVTINRALARAYHEELKNLSSELRINETDYLRHILAMPEVLVNDKTQADEKEIEALKKAVEDACASFQNFRMAEGGELAKDLKERIVSIEQGLAELSEFETARIDNIRKRLQMSLEEFVQVHNIDRNRLEQELIFYMEKLDISEEKVRLKTHCSYFLKTMNEESSGKKLSFIAQEIGREINTIGSKANDAEIQKVVVVMKDELEKIKEQVLNIL